jgi:hypothetical protein
MPFKVVTRTRRLLFPVTPTSLMVLLGEIFIGRVAK